MVKLLGSRSKGKYRVTSELHIVKRSRGCTESPVATLLRSLRELNEGEGILIRLDNSRFPLKALEVLVKKMGFEFEYLGSEKGLEKCLVYKTRENRSNSSDQ